MHPKIALRPVLETQSTLIILTINLWYSTRVKEEDGPEPDNEKNNHFTKEDPSNLKAEAPRLASIDETEPLSRDLISLQTPTDTAKYSTHRQFSWKDSLTSQSSITSFTTLAITRVNEEDEATPTEDNTETPVFEEKKSLSIPDISTMNPLNPSYSMGDIVHTVENEGKSEPLSVDLVVPKPKPKPRTAKKSESNTKGEDVKLDLMSSSSKRKSFLVRSTSVDAIPEMVDSEGKPEPSVYVAAATLSRPKPKPRPRMARKSESSAKGEEVRLDAPLPQFSVDTAQWQNQALPN